MSNEILINTPPIYKGGGVSNHYKGLKKYWNKDVHYNYIGGRYYIPGVIIFMFDLLKFVFKCLVYNPKLVVLNPSLRKNAIKRDGVFLKIAKFLNCKVIVFFHGWDKQLEKKISKTPQTFLDTFNKADAILVLASAFRDKLKSWGITTPVYLTTTKVNDDLINNFEIAGKKFNKNILFLSRVEIEKGIFTTLKAFQKVKKIFPDAILTVAGTGTALEEAKEKVKSKGIKDVKFTGYITGEDLIKEFANANLYILPTHGEGMPTSVLEAMAFGLPIITRPVGGMVDFFENEKMGIMLDSLDPSDYGYYAITLLEDKNKLESISHYNHKYAKKNFLASKKALELENIFSKVT